jgi:hypothetical protein
MADRAEVLIVGYLIGRNTWNSKQWPLGCDSLPSAAREFRRCRQPKRISIATLDYGGRLAPMLRAFWHMVAGAALPSYHFAERSTSERRLGAVSAENASSGLVRSRGRDRCID